MESTGQEAVRLSKVSALDREQQSERKYPLDVAVESLCRRHPPIQAVTLGWKGKRGKKKDSEERTEDGSRGGASRIWMDSVSFWKDFDRPIAASLSSSLLLQLTFAVRYGQMTKAGRA